MARGAFFSYHVRMDPLRLYIAPLLGDSPPVRLFRGNTLSEKMLYKKAPEGFSFPHVVVTDIHAADFVVVSQSIRALDPATITYLEMVKREARAAQKPCIVFAGGDLSYRIHVDGTILFTISTFRDDKRAGEVVAPVYCEDLSELSPVTLRAKRSQPVIGFCGYAGFPNLLTRMKYYVRNASLDLYAFASGQSSVRAHKRGIYFRRKAMRILAGDQRLETNFIARDFFSGNPSLMQVSGEQARNEFITNIQHSDFVLAPRGEANISTRFYETLALGRIPVLVDTEVVLPLEKIIDYEKFVVRVPHTELSRIGDYIMRWYSTLSEEEWAARQRLARETFEKYLRYDHFFNFVLPRLRTERPETFN